VTSKPSTAPLGSPSRARAVRAGIQTYGVARGPSAGLANAGDFLHSRRTRRLDGTVERGRSLLGYVRETVIMTEAMADHRQPEAEPRSASGLPSSGRAFAAEALEHLDSLHRFARHLAGTAAEAEDLVQDTYARALGAAPAFVAGSNLRAWLFRILRNRFIDGVRRAGGQPFVEDEPGADLASYAREPLRGDAEMEALRGLVAHDIERALAALSPDARAVILLDLDGFTETEVAEVLGCALGTVKSRLARAREALRLRLDQYRR
jgi:RNA polymerase sigma-70 factor, ECF subfamily